MARNDIGALFVDFGGATTDSLTRALVTAKQWSASALIPRFTAYSFGTKLMRSMFSNSVRDGIGSLDGRTGKGSRD